MELSYQLTLAMEFLRAFPPSLQSLFVDASCERCGLVLHLEASRMGSLFALETTRRFGANFKNHCADPNAIYKCFKSEEGPFRPDLRRSEVLQKIAFLIQTEQRRGYLNYDLTVL